MSKNVLTYYLTENDISLIKVSLQAHINQCERFLTSLDDKDEITKVENKIKELNELLIGM
jgi:hypothetical protein